MPEPSAASCSRTFQSTLPTRGSDPPYAAFDRHQRHFNPRSPRGGATHPCSLSFLLGLFQSTLPTRGSDPGLRLCPPYSVFSVRQISIHAPHLGVRRRIYAPPCPPIHNFNPRSPRGGATSAPASRVRPPVFQSTLPTRGSDWSLEDKDSAGAISIHAPHEGERRLTMLLGL